MSDNIFVFEESSSDEYETSSEEEVEILNQINPTNLQMYEHTNYRNDFLKNMPIIIDVKDFDSNFIDWNVTFDEPINVHKICDIYLDNIVTHNCKYKHNVDQMYFLLGINEFEIKVNIGVSTNSTSNNYKNKVLIPNDNPSDTLNLTVVHRSKKLNYVSTIKPKIINKLTGTFSTLTPSTHIWKDETTDNMRFLAEFIFIYR